MKSVYMATGDGLVKVHEGHRGVVRVGVVVWFYVSRMRR